MFSDCALFESRSNILETGIMQLNVNRFLSSIPANIEVGKIQSHRSDFEGLCLYENQDVNTLLRC